MRIGVLGTGTVGRTLAGRWRELGHDVLVGSRSAGEDAVPFSEAAAHGELVVNATAGAASVGVLESVGAEALVGKVLLDVANPIAGFEESVVLDPLGVDSLAEQLQRAVPGARVVKGLNTMNAAVMVHPEVLGEAHDVFLAGDDDAAKQTVRALLVETGWPEDSVRDLGGLVAARGLEMYLGFWLALASSLGRTDVNVRVVVPGAAGSRSAATG